MIHNTMDLSHPPRTHQAVVLCADPGLTAPDRRVRHIYTVACGPWGLLMASVLNGVAPWVGNITQGS
jgi:hypothetical protein